MKLEFVEEIKGGYCSKVELYLDLETNIKWVLKTVAEDSIEEINNEKFFLQELKSHDLNPIEFNDYHAPNQMLLEYLENSTTVGTTNNAEAYRLFGEQVAKMHKISYQSVFKIDSSNQQVPIQWKDFIAEELEYGLKRIEQKKINFTKTELSKISERITQLANTPYSGIITLLHCDLHTNNALFVELPTKKVYLFDKGSSIVSGHAYYDLAIILIEFPHIFGLDKQSANDSELLEAFIQRYGFNFWKNDNQLIKNYVLLRAIGRIGSPFNPYLEDLIKSIISE